MSTSQHIQTLLAPPDADASFQSTMTLLNTQFKSFDQLGELDASVKRAFKHRDDFNSQVRFRASCWHNLVTYWIVVAQLSISQSNVANLISETRSSAELHLNSAQELSLLRHSLTDELSYLSHELVSSMSEAKIGPTLLEDIETLHRSLKELESVKSYVQIIEHALELRSLTLFLMMWALILSHLQRIGHWATACFDILCDRGICYRISGSPWLCIKNFHRLLRRWRWCRPSDTPARYLLG